MIDLNYTFLEREGFCSCRDALNQMKDCPQYHVKVEKMKSEFIVIGVDSIVVLVSTWQKAASIASQNVSDEEWRTWAALFKFLTVPTF